MLEKGLRPVGAAHILGASAHSLQAATRKLPGPYGRLKYVRRRWGQIQFDRTERNLLQPLKERNTRAYAGPAGPRQCQVVPVCLAGNRSRSHSESNPARIAAANHIMTAGRPATTLHLVCTFGYKVYTITSRGERRPVSQQMVQVDP